MNTKTIIRETYILEYRQKNIFDSEGCKVPNGKPYILISTTNGNIAFKDFKKFLECISKILKGQKKVAYKEVVFEFRRRSEFNEKGQKVYTGSPYVWIQSVRFGISIDFKDLEQLGKDIVELLKLSN